MNIKYMDIPLIISKIDAYLKSNSIAGAYEKWMERYSVPASQRDDRFLFEKLTQAAFSGGMLGVIVDKKMRAMGEVFDNWDVSIIDINPPTVLEFINDRAKTLSSNAANKDRKNIKAFYSWVQQMYGVLYDPTAPVKMKRHEKETRRLIPIPIHAITNSTTNPISSSESVLLFSIRCHFCRHPLQQVAVACWAMITGCPLIGVCLPSFLGNAGANLVVIK